MNIINSLCVFCGSAPGNHPAYAQKARDLGELLIEHGITLVYGGSNVGIMRILADTVLEKGGKVIGVMPQSLIDREVKHNNLSEFHVVKTMHERKALMVKLSDAFIALPGGLGTMDELFETLSWNQLEIISKPVGLLNVKGYYDYLELFLQHSVSQGFIKAAHYDNLIVDEDENVLLAKLQLFVPKKVEGGKWIRDLKTNTDERRNHLK
jgi:uncharacterized protein (TIGR00730 family)